MSNLPSSANEAQMIELLQNIKLPVLGAGGGFAPIGFYGWSADYVTGAPQGWLRCEGQEVNIADYPELATFYASQHGTSNYWGGDGITTFAVPDLRGEYIRGAGTNSHANQGNGGEVGEHQDGTALNVGWSNNVSGGINRFESATSSYTSLLPIYNIDKTYSLGKRKSSISDVILKQKEDSAQTASSAVNTFRPTNTSGVFFVKATVSGDANGEVYSTDETICGTWIDGKDVYQRVLTGTFGKITSGTVSYASITNAIQSDIDTLIDSRVISSIQSYALVADSSLRSLDGANVLLQAGFSKSNHLFYVGSSNTSLSNATIYIIVRYTKS